MVVHIWLAYSQALRRTVSQGERDFVPPENYKTNLRAVREITTHKTTFSLWKMCWFTVFTECIGLCFEVLRSFHLGLVEITDISKTHNSCSKWNPHRYRKTHNLCRGEWKANLVKEHFLVIQKETNKNTTRSAETFQVEQLFTRSLITWFWGP